MKLKLTPPLAATAIATTAVLLASCGGTDAAGTDAGPTTVTFWHGYTEADGDALEQIVQDFNASQSDVVIETEVRTWDVIDDTLLPALSAEEGPEIVAMPAERLPVYADRGAFADLTDFYADEAATTAQLTPQAVDMVTVEGAPYAVPTGFVPLSVFYNKALFAQAGITEPPTTWDEWLADARALTVDADADGTPEQYGLALPDHATVANGLWPSLFAGGGGSIVDDGTTATIDSPENAETLDFWVSAVRDDKISPTGLDGIGADELFSSGKAAMHVGGPWMASIAVESGIDYGIAALPAGPVDQAASAIGVSMGVTAEADEAQAAGAEAFFAYFFSTEVATTWSLASGWPPLRTDIPATAVAENDVVTALTGIAGTGRALLPGVVNSTDVLTAVDTLTQRAVQGEDVATLLQESQTEVQAAVDD